MIKYGLVVNQVSPQQQQQWYDDVARVIPNLVGTTFDRTTYNTIEKILRDFRSRQ
jgi:hypothetical protein